MLGSSPAKNKQMTHTTSACCTNPDTLHLHSLGKVSSRQKDRVVLTMMTAALGACRGHAVVDPTYATEKKGKRGIMRNMQHSALQQDTTALVQDTTALL